MSTKKIELLTEGVVDTLVLYTFLKKLTTPFEKWPAYKLGIIDENGKVLRKRKTLTEPAEKRAFTLFDVLVLNIKKLIGKLPAGKTRIATFLAGLYLVREQKNAEWYEDEDMLYESFTDFYEEVEDDEALEKELLAFIKTKFPDLYQEDAPANNIGSGNIATYTPMLGAKPSKKKKKGFRDYL